MSVLSCLEPIQLEKLSERPKVSILLSNYNYGEYISQAIDSVLAQTYQNYELIVCDDGSTDNSREIVAEYCRRDPRIRLIAKKNGGQGSGFNAAFAVSTGELICFLDSDDIFHSEKIRCIVEAHQRESEAGFGLHRIQRVNKQRQRRGVWPREDELPQGWYGEKMLQSGGVLANMPPTSGLSLHRTAAERIFPLPEGYPLTAVADQVITRLAPLLTSVLSSREILAEYRLHGTNSYGRAKITAESMLREITICRSLWTAQRDFLKALDPEVASQLQSVESNSYLIYLEYVYARLARLPSAKSSYYRFIRDTETNPHARDMWFWKASIYLPLFLFDALLNLMCGQSLLKEAISRFRRIF